MQSNKAHRVVAEIYRSGYFTNHGPQARELERGLEARFNARHAVVVSNESLAAVMALAGLGMKVTITIAPNAPQLLRHAATIAGLIHSETAGNLVGESSLRFVAATWADLTMGNPARFDPPGVRELIYAHGTFPREAGNARHLTDAGVITVGIVGDGGEVPSTHCAFILTRDDALAEKYRNIRSSYGARQIVDVTATANGRVSEFQAGMALRFLQQRLPALAP